MRPLWDQEALKNPITFNTVRVRVILITLMITISRLEAFIVQSKYCKETVIFYPHTRMFNPSITILKKNFKKPFILLNIKIRNCYIFS